MQLEAYYERRQDPLRFLERRKDFRERLQIAPEWWTPTNEEGHSVRSIGRSAVDGLWYGWSHRAYHGFKSRQEAIDFAKSVS